MNIIINNAQLSEPEFLVACVARVTKFCDDTDSQQTQEINCFEREPSGWLEYGIVLSYQTGGKLVVGAIQRKVGAEIEFHS